MNVDARPLYLLGQQRLDALGNCIQQALPQLARDWWGQDNRVQLVAVSMWNEELRSSSVRCVVRDGTFAWLAFLGTEQAWLKLAESWLGCEVPADSPLTKALHREFCRALYSQLAARDAGAVVLEESGWPGVPAGALTAGGGALVIELDVDGIPLTLLAAINLWPEFASWPESQPAGPMQQVASALADVRLKVDVRLPCVRIPMNDMGSIAVGDFLDLEHDLSGRVRVTGQHVDVSLPAIVGRHGECKAVRIENIG